MRWTKRHVLRIDRSISRQGALKVRSHLTCRRLITSRSRARTEGQAARFSSDLVVAQRAKQWLGE